MNRVTSRSLCGFGGKLAIVALYFSPLSLQSAAGHFGHDNSHMLL